jgi:integral membrane protein
MIKAFRIITLLEGFSLLVLLFLAMPLKYIWNLPQMVRVVGMAHGILFLLFVGLAIVVFYELKWSIKTLGIVMFASLIPFGYIYIDKKHLKD